MVLLHLTNPKDTIRRDWLAQKMIVVAQTLLASIECIFGLISAVKGRRAVYKGRDEGWWKLLFFIVTEGVPESSHVSTFELT